MYLQELPRAGAGSLLPWPCFQLAPMSFSGTTLLKQIGDKEASGSHFWLGLVKVSLDVPSELMAFCFVLHLLPKVALSQQGSYSLQAALQSAQGLCPQVCLSCPTLSKQPPRGSLSAYQK